MHTPLDESRDTPLSALLRQWRPAEPRADFHAQVWRRLRNASAPESARWPMVLRRVWVNAAAAAAGILVGTGLAFAPGRAPRTEVAPLLGTQTLAGAYLAVTAGGLP